MGTAALILLAAAPAAGRAEIPFLEHARVDPAAVVTAESCGECHLQEYEVWKATPHATGFRTMHRKEQAEQIAGRLGFRLIKRNSFCYSCHYTPVIAGDSIRVVSGVSCESCHGAGRPWMDLHNDYGEGRDHRSESAAHRAERIERSRAAGMRRPSDLYPVVANCFSCHTVPNERLVNVGGHATGSTEFEFVKWSQGEIRHNFLDSTLAGRGPANAERPPPRRRVMYVVGRALDLEYSLRAAAEATAPGVFARATGRRVRNAVAELRAVAEVVDGSEIDAMLATVKSVRVVPDNRQQLLQAAEAVGRRTREFLERADGSRLAALDPLVAGTAPVLQADAESEPATLPGDPDEPAGAEPAAGAETESAAAPAAAARDSGIGVEGTYRTRIRPPSRHRTVGPGACSGCHGPQNQWWFGDPHYRTADPFFDGRPENVQIARLYGLQTRRMTRGDRLCMDCHGTVVSGKESREVLDGVGCEGCHGAAADWLEPHKVGEGADRPGFFRALELGKRDPRDAATRAENCTGCHYVTDPRLLSAGHPSGAEFDYVRGLEQIRHWERDLGARGALAGAFAAAMSARGPVPRVRRARLAAAPAAAAGASTTEALAAVASAARRLAGGEPSGAAPRVPLPRPGGTAASGSVTLPELGELPEVGGATPIEDVLLMVRDRLRRLYDLLQGAPEP